MKLEINEAGFCLDQIYPYLGPGVLCQHPQNQRQWVGLPLRQRLGYLSLTGTYTRLWYNNRPSLPLKEFDSVQSCQYCRGDLSRATRGREIRGFLVLEDHITLEDLVERRYLHAYQLRPAGISRILEETFHEARLGLLTTEPVQERVAW
jgi:hypothetical protein